MRKTPALAPPPLLLLLVLLPPPPVGARTIDLRCPSYVQVWSHIHTWGRTDARDICRANHTELVSIKTEVENKWLMNFRGGIGLDRKNREREWRWPGGEKATLLLWETGHPGSTANCAYKEEGSLKWLDRSCNGWDSFICSEERVVLVKEEKTWEEALAHCRALDTLNSTRPAHRYDLVSLLTPDDFVFAGEKAAAATSDGVWTGLRFIAGRWLWVDGEEVQGGQQIPGEPTQGCLSSCGVLGTQSGALGTQSGASIQAADCSLRKNFLCYKDFHDRLIEVL